ncbi:hypothetical protein Bca52824_069696 [Brassica carinata]|uniref:Uncharacterized protein n=1 Tax=Brassica carinata TaxID=52824 RepID=A0A8X7Q4T2_BRACI|nr:hypothetical protein Bca52824_069696 [Brassica carinata]
MDPPTETEIEISDDSNSFEEIPAVLVHSGSSSPVTPKTERIPVVPLTFGGGSSGDVSPNHDSDSSFSEIDSEAEAFYSSLNHNLVSPGTMDGHEFSDKQFRYGELMMKYVQCEEELRITTLQLQDSEQEVEKLKGEAEKRESDGLLAENLRAGLEAARREIEMKDADIETEKRRALELQLQVADLESQLSDSTLKLEADISALKTDLASRDEHIEALNKDFDKHKLGYDMLMAEKDGVCAEVDNLKAEMRARDIQIKQMEEQLNQMVYKETELVSESGNDKSTVEELRARVKELEKQAELQSNAISEGEEEKREAIRQLCFSLDHYKSGYRQLLRFLSNK